MNSISHQGISFESVHIENKGMTKKTFVQVANKFKKNPYVVDLGKRYNVIGSFGYDGISIDCYESPYKTTKLGKLSEKLFGTKKVFSIRRQLGDKTEFNMYLGQPDGFWFPKKSCGRPIGFHDETDISSNDKDIWCWRISSLRLKKDIVDGLKKYSETIGNNLPQSGSKPARVAKLRANNMIRDLNKIETEQKALRYTEELNLRIKKDGGSANIIQYETYNPDEDCNLPTISLSGCWDFHDLPNSFSCTPEQRIGR